MNSRYRKILRSIDDGGKPVVFTGRDAVLASELIEAGFAEGEAARGEDGAVFQSASTGLTFSGRCAIDDASFFGHVGRLYDLLIGVVIGAVTGGVSSFLGMLLAKTVLK